MAGTIASRDIHDELVFGQIAETWETLYRCDHAAGIYSAHRCAGGPLLTAAAPGDLAVAIYADWSGAWTTADEEALDGAWIRWFDKDLAGGAVCAFRLPWGPLLTAATPGELNAAIQGSHDA